MKIRVIEESKEAVARELAEQLLALCEDKPKVALFLSGGSSVIIYKYLLPLIEKRKMGSLVLALVDERFSTDIAFVESNYVQINTKTTFIEQAREHYHDVIPVLEGRGFDETVSLYNRRLTNLFGNRFYKIAIVGIGADGHTAGILPMGHGEIFRQTFLGSDPVVGYKSSGQFKERITLSPYALKEMASVFTFACGEEKTAPLQKVLKNTDPLYQTPAVLLNQLKNVRLFTDQKLRA